MRTKLRISIILNCALLGCLALLLLHGRRAPYHTEAPTEANSAPPVLEAAMPTPVAWPTAEVKPFHWSQIESTDYRIYIANLRAIGCPEQTIRDIISADVDSLYASRREPLEGGLTASSPAGRLAAEAGLRKMRNEEAAAVTALLVNPPAAVNAASVLAAETSPLGSGHQKPPDMAFTSQLVQTNDPAGRELGMIASGVASGNPPTRSVVQKPSATISLPLVFHEVDPSVLTLDPQQAQVVNDLRQKFVEEVGAPNQDPNDPAYSERWQTSQPEVDLDLWSMLGINAFQAHQIAAWAAAHQQTPPGS